MLYEIGGVISSFLINMQGLQLKFLAVRAPLHLNIFMHSFTDDVFIEDLLSVRHCYVFLMFYFCKGQGTGCFSSRRPQASW